MVLSCMAVFCGRALWAWGQKRDRVGAHGFNASQKCVPCKLPTANCQLPTADSALVGEAASSVHTFSGSLAQMCL